MVAGPERAEKVRKQLLACYQVVNQFLTEAEVEYFITFGTLLGYHREGDIIKGDEDIDFATFVPHYEKLLSRAHLLPPGYQLHDTSPAHNGPKLYVSGPMGWEADIYFMRDEGDALRSTAVESNRAHMQPIGKKLVLPLRSVTFLEEQTWVPSQVEEWLEHFYGYLGADAVYDPSTCLWRKKG